MSITLNPGVNASLSRTGGFGTSNTDFTGAFHYRRTDTTSDNRICRVTINGGSVCTFVVGNSGEVDFTTSAGTQTPDNIVTHTVNTWGYYVIQTSGTNWVLYFFDDAGNRTDIETGLSTGGGPSYCTKIELGSPSIAAGGQYRYARLWNSLLTTTQLATERTSATPVITSNLMGDWPLADNTDTGDDSGNSNTMTFAGTYSTSAEEPGYMGGGGGASVVPACARMYAMLRSA